MKPAILLRTLFVLLAAATLARAEPNYLEAINSLERAVQTEMRDWGIGGLAVALTDGTRVVYTSGFGEAGRDSIFRAGSISKVFNAIAVMQLVEAGKLDLDAPLKDQPGVVLPAHPFRDAPPVTLRQLLCHRSGLQRESPVGHYLDGSEPTLAATCASLADCVLATAPAAKTRYSNIGPSVAGHLVATVAGTNFEHYQREKILEPLGMSRSAWLKRDVPGGRVIPSSMRVADADGKGGLHRASAPLFDLGTVPAGNLFTTAPDLAKFLVMLARSVRGETVLLKPATLADMWKPQFEDNAPFGLAFSLGKFRAHRTVGHSGAVYGHSTVMLFLPETQLGVVILANEDIVNARVNRLANVALSAMLEVKTGEKPPVPVALDSKPDPTALAKLAGAFESQSYWAELRVDGAKLAGNFASQPCTFTPRADGKFLLNSRLHDDAVATFERDASGRATGFSVAGQKFVRVPAQPDKLPEGWRKYLGSYGPDFIPIVVHEKFGHLYALTENMVDYRLTPVNRHVFGLPPGMYVDELAVFLCDEEGAPYAVDFASMTFKRW
jgi:CubicO group peptidase (beta-lactamase class C family)